jgi:hypothetical protein
MAETLKERMAREAGDTVTVHWVFKDDSGPVTSGGIPSLGVTGGKFRVACGASWGGAKFGASGETHVVNCPACIKHPQFAAAYQLRAAIEAYEAGLARDE